MLLLSWSSICVVSRSHSKRLFLVLVSGMPVQPPKQPGSPLKGAAFVVVSVLSGFVGCMLLFPTTLLLLAAKLAKPINPLHVILLRLHHFLADVVAGFWFIIVGFLHENVFGTTIRYAVETPTTSTLEPSITPAELLYELLRPPTGGKIKIIIMNHRTRLDWMLFWALMARAGIRSSSSLKIVLKDSLAKAPIFGWAMQHFRFLFLSRSWVNDEAHLGRVIEHYKRTGENATFLIFPEGSDLSDENIEKSQKFAREKGLPQYRFILNPRTTGLTAIRTMIGDDHLDSIVDVTNGFTDFERNQRPREKYLLTGRMPRTLHYVLRKFQIRQTDALSFPLPKAVSDLPAWIDGRFHEKEQRLEEFYRGNPVEFTPITPQFLLTAGTRGKLSSSSDLPRYTASRPRSQSGRTSYAGYSGASWQGRCLDSCSAVGGASWPLSVP